MDMTPAQCRAARCALQMSRDELAKAARVGRNTVARLESRQDTNDSTRIAIRVFFERRGFAFPDGETIKIPPNIDEASD